MKITTVAACLLAFFTTDALAENARQLGAHEHGIGQLDIAFDGDQIAIALHVPGADIVGFEYLAQTPKDRDAVNRAIVTLESPLDLFAVPAAAVCRTVEAHAELKAEAEHANHGDQKRGQQSLQHNHSAHEAEGGHTEFHAEYLLRCAEPAAMTTISFAYFAAFPNALALQVQIVSDKGALAFDVLREAPVLDIAGRL